MAKTKEELDVLKQEVKNLTTKLKELSEEELKEVIGGDSIFDINENEQLYNNHIYTNKELSKEDFLKDKKF